jgi:hypothetical protein
MIDRTADACICYSPMARLHDRARTPMSLRIVLSSMYPADGTLQMPFTVRMWTDVEVKHAGVLDASSY